MKLSKKQIIFISSMLFGLFFGAGNLIFPVHMGQLAGKEFLIALLGFIVTGVSLPMLGIIAFSKSKANSLYEMASKVNKTYGLIFTVVLYLTIGPLFAIPRCATTSFTVGLSALTGDTWWALLLFSLAFFLIVLFFSLRPSGIVTWVGKIINPVFLVMFLLLILFAIFNPMSNPFEAAVDTSYQGSSFIKGFLEGYNTMDALASLAFGIVVVEAVKKEGITDSNDIASSSAKSGIFSCLLMGIIYAGATYLGASSLGQFTLSENGGIALSQISSYYFGSAGQIFLLIVVTLACIKTAIGLITSISETFDKLFTKQKKYKMWVIIFTSVSFLISNIGLTQIITLSVPVLMVLYPLALTLILLTLFGRFFNYDQNIFVCVTFYTLIPSIFDGIRSFGITIFDDFLTNLLPLYSYGLGWIIPSIIGLLVGLYLHFTEENNIVANN